MRVRFSLMTWPYEPKPKLYRVVAECIRESDDGETKEETEILYEAITPYDALSATERIALTAIDLHRLKLSFPEVPE